jgi:hypothetical protein
MIDETSGPERVSRKAPGDGRSDHRVGARGRNLVGSSSCDATGAVAMLLEGDDVQHVPRCEPPTPVRGFGPGRTFTSIEA